MWEEEQQIKLLSSSLRNFKKVSDAKYSCSCPACGDRPDDPLAARGSFYTYKGVWWYNCFRCGKAWPVTEFLKRFFPERYSDLIFSKLGRKKRAPDISFKESAPKRDYKKIFHTEEFGQRIEDLGPEHYAYEYLINRPLPESLFERFRFVEKFKEFSNSIVPGSFEKIKMDEPRLVIPFYNKDNELIAFQGRSFDPDSKAKYITIKLFEDAEKIYGMDKVNSDKTVYVVEGPIDSMLLENSVADAGSSMKSACKKYPKRVLIWDNEPRSAQIIKKMEKAIHNKETICIWKPSNYFDDINDMVGAGRTKDDIMTEIKENSYSGLKAQIKLNRWRKV